MEKRIELEKRWRTPDQIKELNLDNCKSTSIVGLTDEFTNLETLSLINVGLTSLKGFPKLPNLKRLEISDNRISSGLNYLHTSPKLTNLNLSGNKIKDWEALEPLKELRHLKNLDLFNNDTTNIDNYRNKLFALIPSLKYLDGFDKNEKEVDDSEGDEEEVNGNEEEESGDEDEEGVEDEDDEDEDEDVGLDAVYKDNLEDDSEGDEYEGEEDDEDEEGLDEEEDEDEEDATPRGKKRKLEDGGKEDGESKKNNTSSVD